MSSANKHSSNSAQTRDTLINCAQHLYATRSIDDVSLNEITAAAGQKNRNALQYHFGNRDGLLQAIIDRHAEQVYARRHAILQSQKIPTPAAVAMALVKPLTDYIAENPEGEDYVMIVPQLGVVNMPNIHATRTPGIRFKQDPLFFEALNGALNTLPRREAQQRVFLATSFLFHALADFYRALRSDAAFARNNPPASMAAQLQLAINAMLSAPALSP